MKKMKMHEYLTELNSTEDGFSEESMYLRFTDSLLEQAVRSRSSDVHVEPLDGGGARIRFRIDASLKTQMVIGRNIASKLAIRLKCLAGVDLTDSKRAQEGSFAFSCLNREISVRYSALPTSSGQKVVMRIFDPLTYTRDLQDLGFTDSDYLLFSQMLRRKSGLILITGGTGSGKSTTCFSALRQISTEALSLVSIEDPVEVRLPFITQFQTDCACDFAYLLTMILRQDPDVIFLGEIRDEESARAAVRAGNTGHLVLSTIHASDCFSVPSRLGELGIRPQVLSEVLTGVISQRLMRRICPHCALQVPPDTGDILAQRGCYRSTGCPACRHTGVLGQKGLYEVLPYDRELISLVTGKTMPARLRREAEARGWVSFDSKITEEVACGSISINEGRRLLNEGMV